MYLRGNGLVHCIRYKKRKKQLHISWYDAEPSPIRTKTTLILDNKRYSCTIAGGGSQLLTKTRYVFTSGATRLYQVRISTSTRAIVAVRIDNGLNVRRVHADKDDLFSGRLFSCNAFECSRTTDRFNDIREEPTQGFVEQLHLLIFRRPHSLFSD
jgi:hypothetical protein